MAWVALSIYEASIPGDIQKTTGHGSGQSALPEPGRVGKTTSRGPFEHQSFCNSQKDCLEHTSIFSSSKLPSSLRAQLCTTLQLGVHQFSLSGATILYVPGEFCLWYLPNLAMG